MSDLPLLLFTTEHITRMVDSIERSLTYVGVLERRGVFAKAESMAAVDLEFSARRLRSVADRLDQQRAALIANEPKPQQLQAAE